MATTNWALDAVHSELHFKIKHMMVSTVTGGFGKFEANLTTEGDDISTAQVSFSADVDSITTSNEQRDGHLKSPDFFDAANHPKITFQSTQMEKVSDDDYKMHGNLTMHGVTVPVVMGVNYGGTVKDPYGMLRAGFNLEGKIDRRDFGLVYNGALEAGGVVLGEEVKVLANIEFTKA
jgi:polyisoprenoid-binding protein YceI